MSSITQADAVPKCDTVEVEKQIEVFLKKIFRWLQLKSMLIFTANSVFQCAAQVMEKSCQPQTEQMCNPPKKQPTQEKVHQVGKIIWKIKIYKELKATHPGESSPGRPRSWSNDNNGKII